ncbi:MAG: hypothetical protein KDD33_01010 [Bdellovibrionales bacterium]|nr:hypothetical protein [Bdellovibrionales bacterium]
MKLLGLFISLFLFLSCTTGPFSEGRSGYVGLIDKYSAGDKQFSGLYQNFEFRTTILNHQVTEAIYNRMQQFYDWSEEDHKKNLSEATNHLEKHTRFWMSFFTPDNKNDNLTTKKSIWKIYLLAGGRRWEGHVLKTNKVYSEAQALFPYHNRWATSYYVDFPVPTSEVEALPLTFVVTGPLGRREVKISNL